ncbi:unnamed protein product [Nesidiocoris tenuis]|uniref:Uncharacterized protein n=1 Tax=Nesidiocoris tenuis TaxID=355587 RepID=A0A6H5HRG9_9HEMI|nr:unnamed protein product [Nesidiocoris tenuis]
MPERGGDQEQTRGLGQKEEGIKTRRELHVKTRRGSRTDVMFRPKRGGDQDQTCIEDAVT